MSTANEVEAWRQVFEDADEERRERVAKQVVTDKYRGHPGCRASNDEILLRSLEHRIFVSRCDNDSFLDRLEESIRAAREYPLDAD